MENLLNMNDNLFFALHNTSGINPMRDQLMLFVADKLDLFVILFGILFLILHKHKHKKRKDAAFLIWFMEGIYITISVMFGWLISYIIKHLAAVPRPFIKFTDIEPLFMHGAYDSFPSGHATLFAALAVAIFWHHKRAGTLFIILAIIISAARVVAGVHMPIEIIIGWIIGGLSAWFISTKIHT